VAGRRRGRRQRRDLGLAHRRGQGQQGQAQLHRHRRGLDPRGKHVQGIIRKGDAWQIGWEFNGKINDPGTVVKSNASPACASL
jgi:hypothetical protein